MTLLDVTVPLIALAVAAGLAVFAVAGGAAGAEPGT